MRVSKRTVVRAACRTAGWSVEGTPEHPYHCIQSIHVFSEMAPAFSQGQDLQEVMSGDLASALLTVMRHLHVSHATP